MSFRINLDPNPIYRDDDDVPCAGGTLNFYTTETMDALDVYADEALGTNLGPTITLDSSGRASTDLWGSGTYRVILKTADDVTVWDRDPVEIPGGSGTSIPALDANKFLTNDGATMSWATVDQLPDMTGNSGKILGTDGSVAQWQSGISDGGGGNLANFVAYNIRDKIQTVAAAATTELDFSLGGVVILNQDTDITTLNLTGTSDDGMCLLTIWRHKDNTGTDRDITWPGSVTWLNGAPTLPSVANGWFLVSLATLDNGVTWLGQHS